MRNLSVFCIKTDNIGVFVQIETEGVVPNIPEEDSHDFANEIGLAVDVGTSTVAVSAWSLKSRKCLATVAEKNAQIREGRHVFFNIDVY